jgi:hypothetical protein
MPEQSIDEILQHPARKIVVAEAEIDMTTDNKNDIFILLVEESRGSAGGRAAGSGVRRIIKVMRYSCNNGMCIKSFETDNTEAIELFDIPYSAVAMDIKLFQGKQIVVQGIVDPDLVASYVSHLGNTK